MDTKESKAISKLLKKLTALRATLLTDERALLDALVTRSASAADEMVAHRMSTAISSGAVSAGAVSAGAISAGAKSLEEDEMVAHAMSDAVAKKPVPIAQPRITAMQISFDEKTKSYKLF